MFPLVMWIAFGFAEKSSQVGAMTNKTSCTRKEKMIKAIHGMGLGLFVCIMTCGVCAAQVDASTGTIRGTVYDPSGAVIPSATVTAKNIATGVTRTTVTGADGRYQLPQLNPATYELQASAPGFRGEKASQVVLTVGQIVVLDGHLTIGSSDSVVVVDGNVTPLIDTDQTQQANTLNEDQVQNLPNASRVFTTDVFILPGVGSTAGAQAQNQGFYFGTTGISIGAGNGRGNLITVNSGEDDYGTGAIRYFPPLDSVQETQVNRNGYQAEFGFASGAAINTITKSGTDQFHGDAFGYFDDHITNAENYLSKLETEDPATGVVPPNPYSQQVFAGGSIGGPILHKRVFFFASYEYQRFDTAVTYPLLSSALLQPFGGTLNDTSCFSSSPSNPDTAPSQGCFFHLLSMAGAADPADAALATAFLNSPKASPQNPSNGNPFFPLSSKSLTTLATEDNGTHDEPVRNQNLTTRFDYQVNNSNTVTASLSLQHGNSNLDGEVPDGVNNPVRDYEGLVDYVHIFNPNLFNKVLVQVALNRFDETTIDSNGPEINIQGLIAPFGTLGHNFANTYLASEHRFEGSDDLSLSKGHHNAKFGLSYRPAEYIVNNPNYAQGEFDFYGGFPIVNSATAQALPLATGFGGFSALVPYLAAAVGFCPNATPCVPASVDLSSAQTYVDGVPYSFEGSSGSGKFRGYAHYAGIYAQDAWKIKPNLTLTYGGRVDWDAEPSPLKVYKFFSPRVGLAWSPYADQKTVVRIGGGAFVAPTNFLESLYTNLYGPLTGPNANLTTTMVNESEPNGTYEAYTPILSLFQASGGLASPTPAQETAAGLAPGTFGRLVNTLDPNFTNQKVYQASVSVAQQLASNLSVELSYLFYRGNHLPAPILLGYTPTPGQTVINPVIGPLYSETAAFQAILPGGQDIDYSSRGSSLYNGATVSITRRLANHFQFQANYTWSRSIDDTVDFNQAFASFRPNGLSLQQERGLSDFNVTNVLVISGVYNTTNTPAKHSFLGEALAKISVGPVFYASSGSPFDIDLSSPATNDTPIGNLMARAYHAQRNSGLGPGSDSFNLRFSKGIPLGSDNGLLLFTVDTSNLFNAADFTSVYNFFPSSVAGNTATGTVAPSGPFGPNNETINFAQGPFNFHGGRPANINQVNTPLFYNGEGLARQIQLGLKLTF